MNDFNLLFSTSRYNEKNAIAELWFALLMCGDAYPIISRTQFPGLIKVLTDLKAKGFISDLKKILNQNPKFFNFVLKILPVDYTCETNTNVINSNIQEHYRTFISNEDSFKIILKRRKNENIDRDSFIEIIAKDINNTVNLENPDKVIRIEVLGKVCGISFLQQEEILKIIN